MKNISIARITSEVASRFWQGSPHASVFTHPMVLSRLTSRVDWWLCCKGNDPLALWPVTVDATERVAIPPLAYFVGPMMSEAMLATPAHRRLATDTAVFEGFIATLTSTYPEIVASLPLDLQDVRVFDWWNYHEPHKGRFQIRPRYTARIHSLRSLSLVEVMAGYRELRRREVRRIERTSLAVPTADWTGDEILRLYLDVMSRQGLKISEDMQAQVRNLVRLVQEGFGYVIALRESLPPNELAYAALVLTAKGAANLVLNVVSDRCRDTGLPAVGITQAIAKAQEQGCDVFDFNGANSPKRGDDKHSYGSVPSLYFDISLSPARPL